ncbi:MAG: hypothetical protein V7K41_25580 [Nostoc sp.]|uniref:hypothetical protein n=1 Tax=Nostoc sp. TaxID=1180 RepID=UPI002FFD52DA
MANLGVLAAIHPNDLTPDILLRSLLQQLQTPQISLPTINLALRNHGMISPNFEGIINGFTHEFIPDLCNTPTVINTVQNDLQNLYVETRFIAS